jgi:glutamyl-tRNA synthetase/glutamyl-Q tRNA(Asp) synthetase
VLEPGPERFDDALLGAQEQDPVPQCGDLLLRDRDGHWTYQFAVTVDDWRQDVHLVIRGADLLASTGRQIRLARMLGRGAAPMFLHHPILIKPSGEKLSKSSGDTGVRDLRAAGVTAPEVIGRAAAAVGLLEVARPLAAGEVPDLFRGTTALE